MQLVRRIAVVLGVIGFLLCCGAVLLFNRPKLGWQLLSIPTGSMRPAIAAGSLVLVHRVPDSTLHVGNVITYTNPLTMRTTLTHRIIKVYKLDGIVPAFITKGDANPSPDPPVVAGLVQGREVLHVTRAGTVLMWAKTWMGIAVLVYVPALLIIIEETRRMANYLRAMRPYHLEGAFDDDYIEPTWLLLWRKPAKLAGVSALVLALACMVVSHQKSFAVGAVTSNTVAVLPNSLQSAPLPPPPVVPPPTQQLQPPPQTPPPPKNPTDCSTNSNAATQDATTQTNSSPGTAGTPSGTSSSTPANTPDGTTNQHAC